MKLTRLISLALCLTILTLTVPVAAQDATAEATAQGASQTFSNVDGTASVIYPAGWIARDNPDSSSILSVKLGNSESALDKDLFNSDDVFAAGEVHIEVEAIALTKLATSFPAGTITNDSTPLQIVQALAAQGMPDTFTFGDPGEITINDNPAVRMNLTSPDHGEGQLLFVVLDKTWLAGVLVFAAPGEGDKWDTTARDIVGSVKITAEVTPEATSEATQSPTASTKTYTSLAGHFRVDYPATWNFDDRSADKSDDVIGGIFASDEETQHRQLYSDKFESGNIHIEMVIADRAKLATLPALAKISDSTSVNEVAQAFVDAKAISSDLTYGSIESATFENGTAAQVDLSKDDNGDGRLLLIKRDDGMYLFFVVYTAKGELQSGLDAVHQIADSLVLDAEQTPVPQSTADATAESTAEALALTQTVKTQNGLSSLSYPDGWVSRQYEDQSVYVANTEDALSKSFGSILQPGQVNILATMSTTADYIKLAQLPVAADVSPLELLQATVKAVDSSVKFQTPEATTVGDKPAARVDFAGAGYEGTAWLIEYQKGSVIALQMLAAPGEAGQWKATAFAIAASIKSTD